MKFIFSVDVEMYTDNFEHEVYGYGKGLELIINECNKHNITGTFYVEALCGTRWGLSELRNICAKIADGNHEIQLHIHPKLSKIKGIPQKGDQLWRYTRDEQKMLIGKGLDILNSCGAKDICSFRAGDLAANEDTLRVMEELGIYLSSNRNLDQKSSIHTKINTFFPIINEFSQQGNLFDLPITCFKSSIPQVDGKYRHLEICALGSMEMQDGLRKLSNAKYSHATLLTHPREFYRIKKGRSYFIKKNYSRLQHILKFISHQSEITSVGVSECLRKINLQKESPSDISPSRLYSLIRIYSQALDRITASIFFSTAKK